MRYGVVFEKAARNWSAYVPDLPGCLATGKNLDETRKAIAGAIEFHLEGMQLQGLAIPSPETVCEQLEVGTVFTV